MEKSNVVKSKSSNSAITTKSDNHSNKKSRSSGEFQRHVMKKRGVYVEKKATDVSIRDGGNLRDKAVSPPRAPPRPKPGQKRFLASVLTILSKSTAATQFPEKEKPKKTKTKQMTNTVQPGPNIESKVKPKKYRSKVLTDEMFKNLDQQKSLVIQYKNIKNTSSNYSETDSNIIRQREYSPRSSILIRSDRGSGISNEAQGVVKHVLEGLNMKPKKDLRIQEPVTQIEKINNNNNGQNDEQLYNFFVDLLETTFSVYNVKAEYDAAPNESPGSSKVAFELDEAVVNKLEPSKCEDCAHNARFYCVNDTDISGAKYMPPEPRQRNDVPMRPPMPKKRLKTQSFIQTYPKKQAKIPYEAKNTLLVPKKSFSKKAKKKNLMNLLKEQLRMSYSEYVEPQTLYEALKIMAKNKRKHQNSIRFDLPTTRECVFRRPKIISTKRPKKNTKYDYDDYYPVNKCESMFKSKCKAKAENERPTDKYSHHTLEVYGYDYIDDVKASMSVEQEVLLRHQSYTSEDEYSFDNNDLTNKYRNEIDMYGQGRR